MVLGLEGEIQGACQGVCVKVGECVGTGGGTEDGDVGLERSELVLEPTWCGPGGLAEVSVDSLGFINAFLEEEEVRDAGEVVNLCLHATWLAKGRLDLVKDRRMAILGVGDNEEL